jgi:hypothetical protein
MSETFNRGRLARKDSVGMRNLTNVPVGFVDGAVCSNMRIGIGQQATTVASNRLDGFHLKCPIGQLAIGGAFFGTDIRNYNHITLGDFYRTGSRTWTVAARNFGQDQVRWVAGEVCLR